MPPARLTLPPEAASVPTARRFVRATLRALGLDGACEVAEVLVSELATNAVLHARTEFTVEVEAEDERVQILVTDGSGVVPRQRSYGPESTTGRGIGLVDALSTSWGVERAPVGKTVWFVVPAEGDLGHGPEDAADLDEDTLLAAFDEPEVDGPAPTQVLAWSDLRAAA